MWGGLPDGMLHDLASRSYILMDILVNDHRVHNMTMTSQAIIIAILYVVFQ
jgi:hypothetical protein